MEIEKVLVEPSFARWRIFNHPRTAVGNEGNVACCVFIDNEIILTTNHVQAATKSLLFHKVTLIKHDIVALCAVRATLFCLTKQVEFGIKALESFKRGHLVTICTIADNRTVVGILLRGHGL